MFFLRISLLTFIMGVSLSLFGQDEDFFSGESMGLRRDKKGSVVLKILGALGLESDWRFDESNSIGASVDLTLPNIPTIFGLFYKKNIGNSFFSQLNLRLIYASFDYKVIPGIGAVIGNEWNFGEKGKFLLGFNWIGYTLFADKDKNIRDIYGLTYPSWRFGYAF